MKQKLFSILCCLLLSASMVTQAGQTSITQNFTWAGWYMTQIVGTSGSVKCIRYQFRTNTANSYPQGRFVFVYTTSLEASYSGVDDQGVAYTTVVPPVGTYTIGESRTHGTAGSYDFTWTDGNYYNTLLYSSTSSNYFNCTAGSITVAEGADGPYMVFSGTYNNGSSTGNSKIGSAAVYRNVDVVSNVAEMGTATYAYKSGYVYTPTKDFKNGSVYTLTAAPKSAKYSFVEWQKNGSRISTSATTDVTIDGDATYTAVFECTSCSGGTITAEASPAAGGNVSVSPSGSQSGGTYVTLTATPNSGYQFTQWNDGNTTNPRTVCVDGDENYTATFIMQLHDYEYHFTWTDDVCEAACGSVASGGNKTSNRWYCLRTQILKNYVHTGAMGYPAINIDITTSQTANEANGYKAWVSGRYLPYIGTYTNSTNSVGNNRGYIIKSGTSGSTSCFTKFYDQSGNAYTFQSGSIKYMTASSGSWPFILVDGNFGGHTVWVTIGNAPTYTITLNNSSATTSGTTSVTAHYTESTNLTSPITLPTKNGYTFAGYWTGNGGTGTQVIDAEGNFIGGVTVNTTKYTDALKRWLKDSNTTLYAKWTENPTTYTLTLDITGEGTVTAYSDNNGDFVTFTNNEAEIEEDDNITITYTPAPGYRVGSFDDSEDHSMPSGYDFFMEGPRTITVVFEPDANITTYTLTLNAGPHGTVTVYNNTKNYNVTFTNNEAQIAEDDEIVITYTPAAGYHIGTHTDSEEGNINSGDGIFMGGDHTITVTFEPDVYNITYKDKGNVAFTGTHGSGYPTTHTYGTATALVNPTKANATFGGWYENSSCTGSAVTSIAATAKTADFTLYAKWRGTITATASGSGSVSGAGTYDVGANVSLTATPSNSNYYLYDWEKDGVSLGVRTNPLVQSVTANAAYTAIFSAREVVNITASDDMDLTSGGSYWSVSGAGTDGSSNNYTMNIRFDSGNLTGTFNSGVNTANTWVQKSGSSKVYAQSISTATVTEPTTGNLHIVATIIGTDEKKYVITGDYTKPIVGSWANFSWDNPNHNIVTGTQTSTADVCESQWSVTSRPFLYIQAYDGSTTTNNYVRIFLATSQSDSYKGYDDATIPGPKKGKTYTFTSHSETVMNVPCYYYAGSYTESMSVYRWVYQSEVAVPWLEDNYAVSNGYTYVALGQCLQSSYFGNVNISTSAITKTQTFGTNYYVITTEGKDGRPFVRLYNSSNQLLVVIGAPAPTRKVTVANPGSGKTITVKDAQNNTYATGTQHSIPEGTVLTITVSTTDNTHITGWTGTNSGEVIGSGNSYSLTVGAKNYNIEATFEADTHTITWKSEDGTSTLETDNNVAHNAATAFNGETPTKAATAQYTYTFDGWATEANGEKEYNNGGTPAATADATYYAHFSSTLRQYTVTWRSEDGTGDPLETDENVAYGTTTAFNGATPTKAATAQYTYTFDGWATNAGGEKAYNNGETPAVGGDVTYYAHFSSTLRQYTVTWKNGEDVLETDENVAYGATPAYDGATPTKDATAEYTYAFSAWTPAIASVTGDATYTATFTQTPVNYTLTWTTDGDALTGDYTSGTVAYGTAIAAPNTPTKTGYSFTGWRSSISGNVETPSTMPAGDITYTATWEIAFSGIILWDNEDDEYYDEFKAHHGETAGVLYPRQFKQGNWSTLCLPFNVNRATMMSQKLNGSVYEFKYATGDADEGDNVMLYFAKANTMEAGKCYIVNANSALAAKTSFTFSNVTFDLTNDNVASLTSADDYNSLRATPEVLKEGTTISLVGTLRKGTLIGTATGNTYMGLKDNKIWYPNTSVGNVILAYRGLFRSTAPLGASRVRIVVEGETVTELEVVNGELKEAAEARKFVQDGILYIERDGVIYNAQGQKVGKVEN